MPKSLRILGIDPGATHSGWLILDTTDWRVLEPEHGPNDTMFAFLRVWCETTHINAVAVEDIRWYGKDMHAGQSIFNTCKVIGQLREICRNMVRLEEIPRKTVSARICGLAAEGSPNIWKALVAMPRFGGVKEVSVGGVRCKRCKGKGWRGRGRPLCEACRGSGWENPPGSLYGLKGNDHLQAALAVAVVLADILEAEGRAEI